MKSQIPQKKMKRIDEIQNMLDENPNASVRFIAEQTGIPKTSVWRNLTSDMGLVFKVPKIIPHALNSDLRQKRAEKCYELLSILEVPNPKLGHIIIGDEAWLQWTGRVIGKWQCEDDPPPFSERLSQTIKKTMIIVFFSFKEILVADFLSNGNKNNSSYMCEHIWPAIDQKLREKRPQRGSKGIFLHFDNSPIHKSKESLKKIKELGFILLENPAYSPDIAPSDFWLFGFIEEKRKGTVVPDEAQLIIQTRQILKKIDKSILGAVYQEWIKRLHKVIELNGDYLLN